MKSRLEQHKEQILDLYVHKRLGSVEIVSKLGLDITPRSVQRYLTKQGVIRSTKEALQISENRRQATIKAKWSEYVKLPRKAISTGKRYRIMERDGFKCVLCGANASTGAVLEVDHIVPVCDGGSNEDSNLRTLCHSCNVGVYQARLKK